MNNKVPPADEIVYYRGKPLEEMSRTELIECIMVLNGMITTYHKHRTEEIEFLEGLSSNYKPMGRAYWYCMGLLSGVVLATLIVAINLSC